MLTLLESSNMDKRSLFETDWNGIFQAIHKYCQKNSSQLSKTLQKHLNNKLENESIASLFGVHANCMADLLIALFCAVI